MTKTINKTKNIKDLQKVLERNSKAKNVINILFPYRLEDNLWVYDDEDLGVYREAFVMGSSEVINHLVGMECRKFTMAISHSIIPQYDAHLIKIEGDGSQGWYRHEESGMEHWLCGCVLDYFEDYPENIYVKIQSKE